jgi:hypothetical protein
LRRCHRPQAGSSPASPPTKTTIEPRRVRQLIRSQVAGVTPSIDRSPHRGVSPA